MLSVMKHGKKKACVEGHKVTNRTSWKQFNWKLRMIYFRAPLIPSNYDRSRTNVSWRDSEQVGLHTHTF